MKAPAQIDVEFSLALNNRTGKYFAAKAFIDAERASVSRVIYWRTSHNRTPTGLMARALGRLMTIEVKARASSAIFNRIVPRLRPTNAVLFTDPLQVLLYDLKPSDMVVVHDMGPVTHPQFYASGVAELYLKIFDAIQKAEPHLIFVSHSSKCEHEKLYGHAYASRRIIYNPVRSETTIGSETAPAGIHRPFILTVGAVGDRKNQLGTINAFRQGRFDEKGFGYVICGGPEPGAADVVEAAAKTSGVQLIGYATAAELRWLYRNAEGFVLASHLEGFGMPAAEALLNGLLPVLSRDSALMEVGGPEAIFVNADETSSIVEGLSELLAMSAAEKEARVANAKRNLDTFSEAHVMEAWRDFFQEMCAEEVGDRKSSVEP